MTKTRSIPYWTTTIVFSTVTDLVLIYQSVTDESPRTNKERRLTCHSPNEWLTELLYNSGRTEQRPDLEYFVCYLFNPLLRNVCQSRDNALISTSVFVVLDTRLLACRCRAVDFSVTALVNYSVRSQIVERGRWLVTQTEMRPSYE
jgi:hypothetical protein